MHLAYLDDSDTKAKKIKWQVMTGVLIDANNFKFAEIAVSTVRELLKLNEKLEKFDEFHACELYGGYGAFQGIDQTRRFEAIERLLGVLSLAEASVVYGAVDLERIRHEVVGSADPQDVCFRICVKGIDDWTSQKLQDQITPGLPKDELIEKMAELWIKELVLVIADECSDKKLRDILQRSYRSLRPRRKEGESKIYHLHDDMYFGDSRYSVGIQLADLCSYFIARNLERDAEILGFYELIRPYIVFREVYPPELIARPPLKGQLTLASLRTAQNEPIQEVRQDDGTTIEGSTQRDQREAGSGEES